MELSEFEKTFLLLNNIDFDGEQFIDFNNKQVFSVTSTNEIKDDKSLETIQVYECEGKTITINRLNWYRNSDIHCVNQLEIKDTTNTIYCTEIVKNGIPKSRGITMLNGHINKINISSMEEIHRITSTSVLRTIKESIIYNSILSSLLSLTQVNSFDGERESTYITALSSDKYKSLLEGTINNVFKNEPQLKNLCLNMIDYFVEVFDTSYEIIKQNPEEYLDKVNKKEEAINASYQREKVEAMVTYVNRIKAERARHIQCTNAINERYKIDSQKIEQTKKILKDYIKCKTREKA